MMTRVGLGPICCLAAVAAVALTPGIVAPVAAQTLSTGELETYRGTVESVFMEDRGGTIGGYASCVMCHTWQTSVRFSLETPNSNAGWSSEQSMRNFEVVSQLIDTADPESSRLLLKPLSPDAGGLTHTGGDLLDLR